MFDFFKKKKKLVNDVKNDFTTVSNWFIIPIDTNVVKVFTEVRRVSGEHTIYYIGEFKSFNEVELYIRYARSGYEITQDMFLNSVIETYPNKFFEISPNISFYLYNNNPYITDFKFVEWGYKFKETDFERNNDANVKCYYYPIATTYYIGIFWQECISSHIKLY